MSKPTITDTTPFVTNGKMMIAILLLGVSGGAAWHDIRAQLNGVVHVDDIERHDIQIQLQNPNLKLTMPERDLWMRRPVSSLGQPEDAVTRQPDGVGEPSVIEQNSHSSVSAAAQAWQAPDWTISPSVIPGVGSSPHIQP